MTNFSVLAAKSRDGQRTGQEQRIRAWDRMVTIMIIVFLLAPLPFARLEAWPEGTVIFERFVTPWSRLHICYTSYPETETREDIYRFTWKGDLVTQGSLPLNLFVISTMKEPIIKWENRREIPLKDMFLKGNFIRVRTYWQPLLLWPFRMLWNLRGPQEVVVQGGGAS
jgi:hypothetical protein